MNRKNIGFLIIFLFFSMFLFIQPIRATARNVYDPEPDYSIVEYGSGYQIIHLYKGCELFWEFTTILDKFEVRLAIVNITYAPYNYQEWILSMNQTSDSGIFIVNITDSYHITYSGGNGYFYLNMWKYDAPPKHPKPTWEWNIRDTFIESYWAKYISFEADEYDYFLVAWRSSNSIWGYGTNFGEAGFMDQAHFDQFTEAMNPYVTGDVFTELVQAFRPTHNDTWYFVWVNSHNGDAYYNISVRFTENYYPEPDPEPDPIPDPEPLPGKPKTSIPSFNIIIIIGIIGIISFLIMKKIKSN